MRRNRRKLRILTIFFVVILTGRMPVWGQSAGNDEVRMEDAGEMGTQTQIAGSDETGVQVQAMRAGETSAQIRSAGSGQQDGLKAELSTSDNCISAGGEVTLILTMTNTNPYPVTNIQTAISLPQGLVRGSGSLSEGPFALAAGESRKITVVARMPEAETESETAKKSAAASSASPSQSKGTAASVATGDEAPLLSLMMLAVIGMGILLFFLWRKKKYGTIRLFFCLLLVSVAALLPAGQFRAVDKTKEITVSRDLTADGKTQTISARITYEEAIYYQVEVGDGTGGGYYMPGEHVTVKADAAPEDVHFVTWEITEGSALLSDGSSPKTTFVMPAQNVKLQALYNVDYFILSVRKMAGGAIYFEREEVLYEDNEIRTLRVPLNGNEMRGTIEMDPGCEAASIHFNGQTLNWEKTPLTEGKASQQQPGGVLETDEGASAVVAEHRTEKTRATEAPRLDASLRLLGISMGEKQELSIAVALTNGTMQKIVTDLTENLKNFGSGEMEPLVLDAALTLPPEVEVTASILDWNILHHDAGELVLEDSSSLNTVSQTGSGGQAKAAEGGWQEGDGIGLYMLKTGSTDIAEGAKNRLYTANSNETAFSASAAETIYFPVNGEKCDFYAYYPYQKIVNGTAVIDVSDQSSLDKLDFLAARALSTEDTAYDKNHYQVPLRFQHILSKIEINIKAGAGIEEEELTGIRVELTNQRTSGSYHPLERQLYIDGETGQTVQMNTNAEGTRAEAIVLPNNAGSNPPAGERAFVFTLSSGETLRYAIKESNYFQAGGMHIYNITLSRKAYQVTVEAGEGSGLYVPGATVEITAPEIPGKVFVGWEHAESALQDDPVFDGGKAQTSFTMPEHAVSVIAIYEKKVNLEAAKITGLEADTNNLDFLIFRLTGFDDLSPDAEVHLVEMKADVNTEDGTELVDGVQIVIDQVFVPTRQIVELADLTCVRLSYTVTLDQETSEECELDISHLFGPDTTAGKLRTAKSQLTSPLSKAAVISVDFTGGNCTIDPEIILPVGVSIPMTAASGSNNGTLPDQVILFTEETGVLTATYGSRPEQPDTILFENIPVQCGGTQYTIAEFAIEQQIEDGGLYHSEEYLEETIPNQASPDQVSPDEQDTAADTETESIEKEGTETEDIEAERAGTEGGGTESAETEGAETGSTGTEGIEAESVKTGSTGTEGVEAESVKTGSVGTESSETEEKNTGSVPSAPETEGSPKIEGHPETQGIPETEKASETQGAPKTEEIQETQGVQETEKASDAE